jgi:hypothetical protein
VEYSFTNGYIINLKNTNIAYVKPPIFWKLKAMTT